MKRFYLYGLIFTGIFIYSWFVFFPKNEFVEFERPSIEAKFFLNSLEPFVREHVRNTGNYSFAYADLELAFPGLVDLRLMSNIDGKDVKAIANSDQQSLTIVLLLDSGDSMRRIIRVDSAEK